MRSGLKPGMKLLLFVVAVYAGLAIAAHFLASKALYYPEMASRRSPANAQTVRDEAGNTVYRKEYDAENFAKTFQLVNENSENNFPLTMMIDVDGGSDYRFTINTSFEEVKKVEISKL